jgi:AcrR family transcriptional regulator
LLLASALEVLIEQGYQAMTLEEVAERAGFTRRPIYTLFGSKEQLALTVFEEQIVRFSEKMLQMRPARTLPGTLKRLAQMHTEVFNSDEFRPLHDLQVALNGVALHDDAIHQAVIRFMDTQHERLVAWLAQVCEATGQGFRLPLDQVARIITGSFNGMVFLGYLDPSYGKAELKYELLVALVAD